MRCSPVNTSKGRQVDGCLDVVHGHVVQPTFACSHAVLAKSSMSSMREYELNASRFAAAVIPSKSGS